MHSLRRSCSLESLQTLGNDETDVAGVSNRTRWINDGSENGPQAAASMDLQQNTNDDKGRRFVRKNSKTYSKSWRGRQPKCLQEKHKYFTVSQGNTSSVTEAVKEYEARYLKDLDTDAARQEREYIEAFDAMIQAKQEVRRRKPLKSFIDAANEGNTELYRRSLIERIDSELEKMRLDGFIDDNEEVPALEDKVMTTSPSETSTDESWVYQNENLTEALYDDLETGSSFVEAYNDDGRELIIAEVVIERKAVNFKDQVSLDEAIRENMHDSELILIKNDKDYDVVEKAIRSLPSLFNTEPHSNRSTVYSTASESVMDDDDDVFTDNEDKNVDEGFSSRRETYCDPKGNVRIERVGSLGSSEEKAATLKRKNSLTPIIMTINGSYCSVHLKLNIMSSNSSSAMLKKYESTNIAFYWI
ncbi:unnamed protein product [Acanthoscelides obtectus]|uniref:Uncharacterized protein n=1 Tax=Acanthoscelides obtectus TaxID=200917 RepID=A0A9P0K1Y7_ACAOB|nr:unnamed protein product [Acanthoscelides obtectus]CAK1653056.1 hypothetical protein AOBTE_LOCUS18037 [Acanthoscelides obtectus]